MTHPTPPQRVSGVPFPESYALPGRPDDPSAQVQDAYRQTQFVLGKDLSLFATGMNLQLRIVRESSHSRYRNHPYAALMGLWSRSFLYLADACLLVTRGAYTSTLPLVRSACECIAAQDQLRRVEMEHFFHWLSSTLRPNEAHKAMDVEMGAYFAGETLASDDRLRAVYRPASDLGRPNFGATLIQVGPDSNNLRLALTFADRAFHIGWAELTLGWLLALAERQLRVAVSAASAESASVGSGGGTFVISDEVRAEYEAFARDVDATLADPARCAIEEVEEENYKRYLVHNFRRTSGNAPKKVLL